MKDNTTKADDSTELETIAGWLNEAYNYGLSVYVGDDSVRLTNGSAAHYVDIRPYGGVYLLTGERYGETVRAESRREKDALLSRLSETI